MHSEIDDGDAPALLRRSSAVLTCCDKFFFFFLSLLHVILFFVPLFGQSLIIPRLLTCFLQPCSKTLASALSVVWKNCRHRILAATFPLSAPAPQPFSYRMTTSATLDGRSLPLPTPHFMVPRCHRPHTPMLGQKRRTPHRMMVSPG